MIEQLDHVNLVVDDLEAMVHFYRDVLKMAVAKTATIRGEWIGRIVGLSNVEADVVYLELPAGPRLELLKYRSPEGPRPPGGDQANAKGLRHLAFRVDDVDRTVESLRAAGVRFFSDVHRVPDSQVTYAGGVRKRLVYFLDPEGNILELCEYRAVP